MKFVRFFTVLLINAVLGDEERNNQTELRYDPGELLLKIFNANNTILSRQAGYGLIKFEDQPDFEQDDHTQYGLISFEGQTTGHKFKFEDQDSNVFNDVSIREENSRPLKFEDQPNSYAEDIIKDSIVYQENGIRGDNNKQPLRFEQSDYPQDVAVNNGNTNLNSDNHSIKGGGQVTFQDDNRIEGQKQKKKKRRRRRKPRRQQAQGYGLQGQGFPGTGFQYPGPRPGIPGYQEPNPYINPGFHGGQFYRPPRRPKHSKASEALTAVTRALTSIALYDDYQCVPRLLCEAAGGGALGTGALGTGSTGLLQSIVGLQPLLTLLSAYNGISTSPLFVFGRAVFLGMTSKANPGTCRYAYPLCPTDPEQLVHYLNNHNGGFFRFFSAPNLGNPQFGQQNVEQFYNQLSVPGQNYGIYQPEQHGNQPIGHPAGHQSYGIYNNVPNQQPYYGPQRPNLYNGPQQSYGPNYPYQQNRYGINQVNLKSNKEDAKDINSNRIEKRIQNHKSEAYVDNFNHIEQNSKWLFPEGVNFNEKINDNFRDGKHFVFPEKNIEVESEVPIDLNRKAKGFYFPGLQSNRQYELDYNYPLAPVFNNNDVNYENSFDNIDDSQSDLYQSHANDDEGVELVYVVRGNGDPNNPEIIKLRPGQYIQ